ncbi:MAG: nucleotidyltransferase domain-containing protein [Candidatus Woesearchaeota archaeon]
MIVNKRSVKNIVKPNMANVSHNSLMSAKNRQLSKNLDILSIFLKGYNLQYNGREIARLLSINHQTALDKINDLVKLNILDYHRKGNHKLYFLASTLKTKMYIQMAETASSLIILGGNKELSILIPELLEVMDNIILFGSFSSNTYDLKSDIDIISVGKCKKNEVDKILKKYVRTINIQYVTLKELENSFKKKNPLAKEVLLNHKFFGNINSLIDVLWRQNFD